MSESIRKTIGEDPREHPKNGYRSKKGNAKLTDDASLMPSEADDLSFVTFPESGDGGVDRADLMDRVDARDWSLVQNFWKLCLTDFDPLPAFVYGHEDTTDGSGAEDAPYDEASFGVSRLGALQQNWLQAGLSLVEPNPEGQKKKKVERTTYALRIGYDGGSYHGYQKQNPDSEFRTVEGDLIEALGGQTSVAAGRTDKDVSAVSQIICFHRYDGRTPQLILSTAEESLPVREGRLKIFECVPMPRRFHSLFCATWRRYLFLIPLNVSPDQAEKSICAAAAAERTSGTASDGAGDVDVEFVNAALRHLEGRTVHCNCFTTSKEITPSSDKCTLSCSRAFLVDLHGTNSSQGVPTSSSAPAICVELVGDRFLRSMVRIIVSTVVRESFRPISDRREDILLQCCASRRRIMSALPISGKGIALAGVGYELDKSMKHGYNSQSVHEARPEGQLSHRQLRQKRKKDDASAV